MNKGIDIIKESEGCKLKAYLCPAGIPTIGYGYTHGVKLGMVITQEKAEELLMTEISAIEDQIKKVVRVKLNENELGAITSFVYNLGLGSFKASSILKNLNDEKRLEAAESFLKWNKATVKGKLVVLNGLTIRRKKEKDLFLRK
jgi:lysozyme